MLVERARHLMHPRRHWNAIVVEKRDEGGTRDADARITGVGHALARLADIAQRYRCPSRQRPIDDAACRLVRFVVHDDHFIRDRAGVLSHEPIDDTLEIVRSIVRGNNDREIGH
jgi:hypothetical protein